MAANPHIVMHLESGDDVVILEGVVEEVKDRSLVARMDKIYREKYDFRKPSASRCNRRETR